MNVHGVFTRRLMYVSLFALILAFIPVFAQISQTGTLDGEVYDIEGRLIPGAEVTIASSSLILPSMTTLTNEKGFFRFPSLPPGSYKVTVKRDGFKNLVQKGILVNVSRTTSLKVMLELTTIEETIEVKGHTPTVDKERASLAANLSSEFLKAIPAVRDLDTVVNMIPGVTGDTAHGSSVRDNTYNLDGVNVTDPVIGTRAGSFSMDIVEELSVQTGGHSAEFGGVRGAVVNVVTKSGGNRFSGMASFYYRHKSLQSDNTQDTVFEGQKSGFDYEAEPDINLGGPVIRDKIWFFASFNRNKSDSYTPGYPFDKQPENTALDSETLSGYGKFTFQLTKNDRMVLSYNYSDYKRHHRDAAVNYSEDATRIQKTPVHMINAQWTKFMSENMVGNLKLAFVDQRLNLYAKNNLPRIYDSSYRQYTQSAGYNDLYTRRRFQALADSTLFVDDMMGRHEFKAGLELEFSDDIRDRSHSLDPRSGLGPFFTVVKGKPSYVTHYQDFVRKDRKFVFGGFIQDSWQVSERLSVNVGVRYDHQEGIIPEQGQDRKPLTYNGEVFDPRVLKSFTPVKWDTLSPRLGLSYDISGDGRTVAKASFGRYYSANIMQYFITVNPNAFLYYRYKLDSNWNAVGSMYQVSGQAAKYMDPDIKCPYLDEFSIGAEQELFKEWRLGVRYIRKWDRRLIEDVGLSDLDYDRLKNGEPLSSVWKNYEAVSVTDPYTGQKVTFYNQINTNIALKYVVTNPPGAERDYDGLEVTLSKTFSNRWFFNASYTLAKSRGLIGTDFDASDTLGSFFDNPNAHVNANGSLELERRHQLKATLSWTAPLGINLSCYYRYLSGRPYTRTVRSQDLGLNLNQGNVSIYAEKRGSHMRDALSILDLRLEKFFRLGETVRIGVFADIFNVFNANTADSVQTVSSSPLTVNNTPVYFGGATGMIDPRIVRLGARIEF